MYDTAIHWLLRQRDGDMDAADWEAFTSWLEADERHSAIFDRLAQADLSLEELRDRLVSEGPPEPALLQPVNDNVVGRFVPWVMASAAAMVLAIFVWPQGPAATSTLATGPGEAREVALGDAITMTLNGGTTVQLVDGSPEVTLEEGEVSFAVVSETPSPLRVTVDNLVLTDIGTEFNVVRTRDYIRVAVAEGIVAINPEADAIEVKAGEAAERRTDDGELTLSRIDPETVASWREGRLEFDDTPIDRALAQVLRSTGVRIEPQPDAGVDGARLTGSVAIKGEAGVIATRFAALVGGKTTRFEDADGVYWTLD